MRQALDARTEHLASEGLAHQHGQRTVFARDLLDTLRCRKVVGAVARLSKISGLISRPGTEGENVAGIHRLSVTLASGRFAMIANGLGFELVA